MNCPPEFWQGLERKLHSVMAENDELRSFAVYIPGGVFNMIALVRMSRDEKVRQMAVLWNSLPRKEHRTVNLDKLSLKAAVAPCKVFGSIVQTGFDLGMDVSGLLTAIMSRLEHPGSQRGLEAMIARARRGSFRDRERLFRKSGFITDPKAPAARKDGSDSDLETMEKDTMYFSRMLRASLRRKLRQEARK